MDKTLRESLKKDFNEIFKYAEQIDAENIYDWAVQTADFYKHFYTQFETMCNKRLEEEGTLGSIERTYKVPFLYWGTYEIVPCRYADFFNSLSDRVCTNAHKAGNMIYDYYLQQFKESPMLPKES